MDTSAFRPEEERLKFDTFREYQVWKQARNHDIANGLLGCFSILGILAALMFGAWALVSII